MATYRGDTPLISYDCGEDVSDLATRKLYYKKPDGTTGEWTGTLSGTRYVQYQTVTAEIDTTGMWFIQVYLTDGNKEFHGVIKTLLVLDPISLS